VKVTGVKVGQEIVRPNGKKEAVRAISVILHMADGDDDVFLVHAPLPIPPEPDPEPSDPAEG
jgi:hypothetical protein